MKKKITHKELKELSNSIHGDAGHKSLGRLAVYVIASGWVIIVLYLAIFYEYTANTTILANVVNYFLSIDERGIRFRALILFAPLITTVIGFLVYGKAKLFKQLSDLLKKYEYLSKTDILTGLLNRAALVDSLEYEAERSKRYGPSLSLILCDIDDFKSINDTFGHAEGDKALKEVSKFLKKSIRKIDVAGRYGGDEFMLILPETPVHGAMIVAGRMLQMQSSELRLSKLSLSVGVTYFSAVTDDIDSLVKRADDALYASKKAGKNQVTLIEPDINPCIVKS